MNPHCPNIDSPTGDRYVPEDEEKSHPRYHGDLDFFPDTLEEVVDLWGHENKSYRVYEQHEQHVKISFYDGVTGYVLNQPTMIWVYLKMVEFGVQN